MIKRANAHNFKGIHMKNSLCFKARWISPVTGKEVTALHFSSFTNAIRAVYARPKFVTVKKRF